MKARTGGRIDCCSGDRLSESHLQVAQGAAQQLRLDRFDDVEQAVGVPSGKTNRDRRPRRRAQGQWSDSGLEARKAGRAEAFEGLGDLVDDRDDLADLLAGGTQALDGLGRRTDHVGDLTDLLDSLLDDPAALAGHVAAA